MKWLLSTIGTCIVLLALALVGLGARDSRGRITGAIEIERASPVIFPLLVQPDLRKQWLLGVESVTPVGDPTLRSGARSRVVLDAPDRVEVEEEIRVVDLDKRLLLQRTSSHPPFSQRLEYTLKDVPGGRSLVTAAVHTTYAGVFFNLLEPLITRAAQARLQQELLQLRATAEAPPPAVAPPSLPVVATPTVPVAPEPSTAPAPPPTSPATTAAPPTAAPTAAAPAPPAPTHPTASPLAPAPSEPAPPPTAAAPPTPAPSVAPAPDAPPESPPAAAPEAAAPAP